MKVLEFLNLLTEYQPVSITPDCDLDWNEDNPYVLEPEKVRDLRWFFIRKIADREITEIRTNGKECDNTVYPYLSISYK